MRTLDWILVVFTVGLVACGAGAPGETKRAREEAPGKPVVYTMNYPVTFFAERIGGGQCKIVFPAPADVDPAYWSPDVETIADYQRADLILLNGAGYAKWVQHASLPENKLVDTGEAFSDRLIELKGVTTHSHGTEGQHEHSGWAFTTWLDPELATLQAEAVARALTSLLPDREAEFNERFVALSSEIRELDQRLAAAAEAIGNGPLVFSHPVYQYLIRRYGLNAVEVHWEPDESPDESAWEHLEEILQSHPAKWMLWESKPLQDTGLGLEDLGVSVAVFNPCGNRPEKGNYLTVMAANATALESISR